jgi:integral membrane protein
MNKYSWFRKVAFYEGISFLVLLLIAMPLKYFAGMPLAVTIIGGLHGILYITLAILAWEVKTTYKRTWAWGGKVFLASIIPFGTFYMDKEWRVEEYRITNNE